jgi:hypothetical protein
LYHTTGLHKAEIVDLCEMIHREVAGGGRVWPPILGLYKSVVVALTYMRRNRVQVELAETYGVSQSTISRAITEMTPPWTQSVVAFDLGGSVGQDARRARDVDVVGS